MTAGQGALIFSVAIVGPFLAPVWRVLRVVLVHAGGLAIAVLVGAGAAGIAYLRAVLLPASAPSNVVPFPGKRRR